jgi:hypothetical protein
MLRLVPGAAALAGLDPDSGYHLGQIGGMVLLYHALASTSGRSDTAARPHPSRVMLRREPACEGRARARDDRPISGWWPQTGVVGRLCRRCVAVAAAGRRQAPDR